MKKRHSFYSVDSMPSISTGPVDGVTKPSKKSRHSEDSAFVSRLTIKQVPKKSSSQATKKRLSKNKTVAPASSSSEDDLDEKSHAKSLAKLRKSDPEFYAFLEAHDQKLLHPDFESESVGSDGPLNGEKGALESGLKSGSESEAASEDENEEVFEAVSDGSEDDDDRSETVSDAGFIEIDDLSSSSGSADEDPIHRPPAKLEVASDEEDEDAPENEAQEGKGTKVTISLINKWKKTLKNFAKLASSEKNTQDVTDIIVVLRSVMSAFGAAVASAGGKKAEDPSSESRYIVQGGPIFNATLGLCLSAVPKTLFRLLHVKLKGSGTTGFAIKSDQRAVRGVTKSSDWKRIASPLRTYLMNLLKLLSSVSDPSIICALLRHALILEPLLCALNKVGLEKSVIKESMRFWATTDDDAARLLAFLVILRLLRKGTEALPTTRRRSVPIEMVLRQMYLSYIRNCKFTTAESWPRINFMKRSLAELYALAPQLAYQQGFLFIRQLGIHCRNAITIHEKESLQSVCNWQFLHALLFWGHTLSSLAPSQQSLHPLIYPYCTVASTVISLFPSARYYPLRFHVCRALIELSSVVDDHVPVFSYILDPLQDMKWSKKHSINAMRPLDFMCTLRLSDSQMRERGFKDGVLQQVYDLLVQQLAVEAYRISFPETVYLLCSRLKTFIKACPMSGFVKKMKTLLDKVKENSKWIEGRRRAVPFEVRDVKAVRKWEAKSLEEMPPFLKFKQGWEKVRQMELTKDEVIRETNGVMERDLDVITGRKKNATPLQELGKGGKLPRYFNSAEREKDREEFKELFVSSDEEDENEPGSENESDEADAEKEGKDGHKGAFLNKEKISSVQKERSKNDPSANGLTKKQAKRLRQKLKKKAGKEMIPENGSAESSVSQKRKRKRGDSLKETNEVEVVAEKKKRSRQKKRKEKRSTDRVASGLEKVAKRPRRADRIEPLTLSDSD